MVDDALVLPLVHVLRHLLDTPEWVLTGSLHQVTVDGKSFRGRCFGGEMHTGSIAWTSEEVDQHQVWLLAGQWQHL